MGITEYKDKCSVVYEPQTYNVPVKQCKQGTTKKDFNYKVPQFNLAKIPMNETVSFPTHECEITHTDEKYCVDLPTRLDCKSKTITRRVKINKVVCDQQKMSKYCHNVPYSYCKNVPGQVCEMVAKKVCQPTCQQTDYCNTCAQFASGGGFSQCATATCPNFYSPNFAQQL